MPTIQGGLVESTGAFSLYSNLNGEGEAEGEGEGEPTTEQSSVSKEKTSSKASGGSGGRGVSSSRSSEGGQSGTTKKKTSTKKPKTQTPKINFDERVREVSQPFYNVSFELSFSLAPQVPSTHYDYSRCFINDRLLPVSFQT